MDELEAPQRIECFCSRAPLLARAGIKSGKPFVWIKHLKGPKTIVDVVITDGTVAIRCRECHRICKVRIAETVEISKPE